MTPARNAPCPCGSGKKYKKCCLAQDQNAADQERRAFREAQQAHREAEQKKLEKYQAEAKAFDEYIDALNTLSNRANDLTRSNQWDEAETCCRRLLERFPKEIDGHHRSYEYYKARGDFARARSHAQAALQIVEHSDGFDPHFPATLKKDIAIFDERIQTDDPTK